MAHEIEIVNGVANMIYVGEAPWHKLGRKFEVAPSLEDAIVAAGLDWQVGMKDLFLADGTKVDAKASVRLTDESVLGVVGNNYSPLQNKDAFAFFKPFIDAGTATIECAGSLRQGKRVFVLAKIKGDPLTVKGSDTVERYILLSNSHDGTLAVRAGFTPIRTVCQNTLTMAISSKASKLIRIRHTKSVTENLEAVRNVMNLANSEFESTLEQFKVLANKDINSRDLEKFIKILFVPSKIAELTEGETVSNGQRILDRVIPLFEKGLGNNLPEIKGTWWAAYNAVTEYVQYQRGTNEDIRLDQTWFGAGNTLNKKALETAVLMAA